MYWRLNCGNVADVGSEVEDVADGAAAAAAVASKKKKILPKKQKKITADEDVEPISECDEEDGNGFWARCLECKTRIHDDDDSCHVSLHGR